MPGKYGGAVAGAVGTEAQHQAWQSVAHLRHGNGNISGAPSLEKDRQWFIYSLTNYLKLERMNTLLSQAILKKSLHSCLSGKLRPSSPRPSTGTLVMPLWEKSH